MYMLCMVLVTRYTSIGLALASVFSRPAQAREVQRYSPKLELSSEKGIRSLATILREEDHTDVAPLPVGNLGGETREGASLFEGDVMITRDEALEKYGTELVETLDANRFVFLSLQNDLRIDYAARDGHRWPNRNGEGRAEIAYRFDPSTIPTSDTTRRRAAREAMDRLEDSGVLRFVERTNEAEFFEFGYLDLASCYSTRIGFESWLSGPQSTINLGWCRGMEEVVNIMHEIVHTIGFWHEQSRPDRDNWITVTSNPNSAYSHAWEKKDAYEIDYLGSPYDYASFMHYYSGAFNGDFTFTNNYPLPTCLTDAYGRGVGQRVDASWEDIVQIRRKYQCSSGPLSGPVVLNEYCTSDCPCWENALGDCDDDDECQGDLICGTAFDPGPENWVCEPTTRQLGTNMCRRNLSPVAVCNDIVRAADDTCEYVVTLSDVDGGSHDPDGHVVAPVIAITTPTRLSIGSNFVGVRITDGTGLSDECVAQVQVIAEPSVNCPGGGNTLLLNHAEAQILSGSMDETVRLTFPVNQNAESVYCAIGGGDGDADLLFLSGKCAPIIRGNDELCQPKDLGTPGSILHLGLLGYRGFSSVTIICFTLPAPSAVPPLPPPVNVLDDGVFVDVSGSALESISYRYDVPIGATEVKVRMKRGEGDGDVFTKWDEPADLDTGSFDCASTGPDNSEECILTSPLGSVLFVTVYGASDFSGAIIKAQASF